MEDNITRWIITIDGHLNFDLAEKLCRDLNESPSNAKLVIYFSSEGGSVWVATRVLHILNSNLHRIEKLIIGPDCHSAAFDIAYQFNGDLEVANNTISVLHLISVNVNSRDLLNKESYEVWDRKFHSKRMISEQLKMFEEFLTEDEINTIKDGKDVYLDYKRLDRIMKGRKESSLFKANSLKSDGNTNRQTKHKAKVIKHDKDSKR